MTGNCTVKRIRGKFGAVSEATELLRKKSREKKRNGSVTFVKTEGLRGSRLIDACA